MLFSLPYGEESNQLFFSDTKHGENRRTRERESGVITLRSTVEYSSLSGCRVPRLQRPVVGHSWTPDGPVYSLGPSPRRVRTVVDTHSYLRLGEGHLVNLLVPRPIVE